MNHESRESSSSQGQHGGRSSRFRAALGLAGIAFLSSFSVGESAAQAPLPPSKVEATAYTVQLTPNGTYTAGRPAFITLTITAKAPYSVARDFPWTIKLLNPPSNKVRYTKMLYTNADGVFTDQSATFALGIVPIEAGVGTLQASTYFRVCATASPSNCVTNYVNVALTVPVQERPPKVDDKEKDKAGTP